MFTRVVCNSKKFARLQNKGKNQCQRKDFYEVYEAFKCHNF